MIFSVQRYLEDHFERRGLGDVDQYAVKLANLYDADRRGKTVRQFLSAMAGIRTVFYRRNAGVDRRAFEARLLAELDRRFKKKRLRDKQTEAIQDFPGGVTAERTRLASGARRSVPLMLEQFRRAVEARGVDSFWVSRAAGRLRGRPERIAQALLAVFVRGVIGDRGVVLREVASGVGFVDVGILLSRILHLVELKVIRGSLKGVSQLRQYMKTEGRRRGWLVVMDARRRDRRTPIQERLATPGGTIDTIVVEINPEAPSKQ